MIVVCSSNRFFRTTWIRQLETWKRKLFEECLWIIFEILWCTVSHKSRVSHVWVIFKYGLSLHTLDFLLYIKCPNVIHVAVQLNSKRYRVGLLALVTGPNYAPPFWAGGLSGGSWQGGLDAQAWSGLTCHLSLVSNQHLQISILKERRF